MNCPSSLFPNKRPKVLVKSLVETYQSLTESGRKILFAIVHLPKKPKVLYHRFNSFLVD